MKKISTLFKKDPSNLGRVINEINPENSWVFSPLTTATRKFDGIAHAIIEGELYKRYDVRKGREIPEGAIACQEPDKITGHHPHWVKCYRAKGDWQALEAFDKLSNPEDGTYELCGETISTERFTKNLNVEKLEGHQLIPHGEEILKVSDLSFEGIKEFLSKEDIEGIVFYSNDGTNRMCKIRKKDFGLKR